VNAIIHSKYNDKHRDVILQNENTEQSFVFLTALFSSTFPANLAASLDLKPSNGEIIQNQVEQENQQQRSSGLKN